jgi:hypothetical protein
VQAVESIRARHIRCGRLDVVGAIDGHAVNISVVAETRGVRLLTVDTILLMKNWVESEVVIALGLAEMG